MKYFGRILTIAAALALAAAFPTVVCAQGCGDTVTSDVVLTADLLCVDQNGLTVSVDGVTIDLGGHTIKCVGQIGAPQHCQHLGWVGINTNGHSDVTIKNGIVDRFAIGIHVNVGRNVTVRDVTVTGPELGWEVNRGESVGILVENVQCREGALIDGNTVDNHRYGIRLMNSNCVKIQHNSLTQNDAYAESHGILLVSSSGNTLTANFVNDNGAEVAGCGGITLAGTSSDNRVARNTVLRNCGDGISARDSANYNTISGNSARSNPPGPYSQCASLSSPPFADLADRSLGPNKWARTNNCWTEGGIVPSDVCNPGE